MALPVIRNLFRDPTPEQSMLIGPSCLALTQEERMSATTTDLNGYLVNPHDVVRITAQITNAANDGKASGARLGACAGVVSGAAIGAFGAGRYVAPSLPVIALGALGGGVTGGLAGYKLGSVTGEKLGRSQEITKINSSLEFRNWRHIKYETEVFPALSTYMPTDQWDRVQLNCPITKGWMNDPVHANDGHMYERTEILKYLSFWDRNHPEELLAALPLAARTEVLNTRSPFRNGNIQLNLLKEKLSYYDDLFMTLNKNYNQRVMSQKVIYAKSLANELPMPTEEETRIVNFYFTPQLAKQDIANAMSATVFQSDLPQVNKEKGVAFLMAAVNLPEVL